MHRNATPGRSKMSTTIAKDLTAEICANNFSARDAGYDSTRQLGGKIAQVLSPHSLFCSRIDEQMGVLRKVEQQ